MIKKIIAALAILFSAYVWYMAAHAGNRVNQDWAPIGAVLYGILGGVPLFVIGIGSSVHFLKTRDTESKHAENARPESAPMLWYLNAGWILTALAVIKVAALN